MNLYNNFRIFRFLVIFVFFFHHIPAAWALSPSSSILEDFEFDYKKFDHEIKENYKQITSKMDPGVLEELNFRSDLIDKASIRASKFAATIDDMDSLKHFCFNEANGLFYMDTMLIGEDAFAPCLIPKNSKSSETIRTMKKREAVNIALKIYDAAMKRDLEGASKEKIVRWMAEKENLLLPYYKDRYILYGTARDIETERKGTMQSFMFLFGSNSNPRKWTPAEIEIYRQKFTTFQISNWKSQVDYFQMMSGRKRQFYGPGSESDTGAYPKQKQKT